MKSDEKASVNIIVDNSEITVKLAAPNAELEASSKEIADTKAALTAIFENASVYKIYYIDDSFGFDHNDVEKLIATIEWIGNEKASKIKIGNLKLSAVPPDKWGDAVREKWNELDNNRKANVFKSAFEHSLEPSFAVDLTDASIIDSYFPEGIELIKLNPVRWDEIKTDELAQIPEGKKVLLLFDEDLKQAGGRFNLVKGIELIKELSESPHMEKIHCCLLTWMINKAENEVEARQGFCTDYNLDRKFFLPLSKERNNNPILFSDGIKKALLNIRCENIKDKTIKLLSDAFEKAKDDLNLLDTYVFDNIILKSSFNEGVGENDTLIRICNILIDDRLKSEIISQKYLTELHEKVSDAKKISDVVIGSEATIDASKHQRALRHKELFEEGEIVNKLCEPISNGDIFQVGEGETCKYYILVGQACDLMVRTKNAKKGKRSSEVATLLRIHTISKKKLEKEIFKFYGKSIKPNHFYASKFNLNYFDHESDNSGIVEFSDNIFIDIDILDLAVFNHAGECRLDLKHHPTPPPELIQSWGMRYDVILDKFKAMQADLEGMNASLESLMTKEDIALFWSRLMPKMSFLELIGNASFYKSGNFDFGIKRVKRYRNPGAATLLNRYMRHLSREAEDHDFVIT